MGDGLHAQARLWFNQVEIFFSILTRRLLKHGQFIEPRDLATQMPAYVEHHN